MKVPHRMLGGVAVSVMRDGSLVCVSVYLRLADGRLGESEYMGLLAGAMHVAAENELQFYVEGADDEEGQ